MCVELVEHTTHLASNIQLFNFESPVATESYNHTLVFFDSDIYQPRLQSNQSTNLKLQWKFANHFCDLFYNNKFLYGGAVNVPKIYS